MLLSLTIKWAILQARVKLLTNWPVKIMFNGMYKSNCRHKGPHSLNVHIGSFYAETGDFDI